MNKYIIIQPDHTTELENSSYSLIVQADSDKELFETLQEESSLVRDLPVDIYKANYIGKYKFIPTTTFKLKRTDCTTIKSDNSLKDSIKTVSETVSESIDLSFIES